MHREGKLFLCGNYKTMPKYHPRNNKTEKQFFSRFDFRQTTKPFGLKGLLFKKEKDTHINIQIFQQQFV